MITKQLALNVRTLRRNKKDQCLSVTVESDGGAVWKCHHCEWTGAIAGSNFKRDMPLPKRKEYKRPTPPQNADAESKSMFEWFAKRGISVETGDGFQHIKN